MLKEYERSPESMSREQRKEETKRYQKGLTARQQPLRSARLPVIVLIEGWAAAGKGTLINDLISEIDPRFASVFSADRALQGSERYPFLYPYFNAIPEEGKILFMDSGWMEETVRGAVAGELDGEECELYLRSVNRFERQLRDNGYLLIKIFVDISRKEQKKRLEALRDDEYTAWRVTDADRWQNKEYDAFREAYGEFMERTGDVFAWHVMDGGSKATLRHDAFRLICEEVDAALERGKYNGEPFEEEFPMTEPPRLEDADLSLSLSDEEYKTELKALQKRLGELHNTVYRMGIPVVICYEGWDAAGKGGNIRRLAYPLDPRGFDVYPIASPEPHELSRHYLWRFYQRLPRTGHVAIFDRTWYGRVMVERIEGYCTENDWKRAYNEINEFEEDLYDWGAVVLKFWIHVDQDTQLQRFTERQENPDKRWKITDEDWRNREKWPQYEEAIGEMLEKTSTVYAPWHIIESRDKKYARVKVLRLTVEALEEAIAEREELNG